MVPWIAELNSEASCTDRKSPLRYIPAGSCSANSWVQTNIDLIPKVTTVSGARFVRPTPCVCSSDKAGEEFSSREQNHATVFWHSLWFPPASPVGQQVIININHPAEAGSESQHCEDRWGKTEWVRWLKCTFFFSWGTSPGIKDDSMLCLCITVAQWQISGKTKHMFIKPALCQCTDLVWD